MCSETETRSRYGAGNFCVAFLARYVGWKESASRSDPRRSLVDMVVVGRLWCRGVEQDDGRVVSTLGREVVDRQQGGSGRCKQTQEQAAKHCWQRKKKTDTCSAQYIILYVYWNTHFLLCNTSVQILKIAT